MKGIARRNARNKGGKMEKHGRKVGRGWGIKRKNAAVRRKLNFYGMRAAHDPLFYFIVQERLGRLNPAGSIDKEISARVPWDYVVPVLVNSPAVL